MISKKVGIYQRFIKVVEQELIVNNGYMEISVVVKWVLVLVGFIYYYFGLKIGLVVVVVDQFYEFLWEIVLGDGILIDFEWWE